MTTRRITSSSITSGGGGATVRYQPEQPVGITPGELWVDSDGDTDVVDAETFLTKESASASYVYKTGDTITGPTVITANSSSDVLRITQTGSGNALVVEDSTNPDSTPFVIDNAGKVLIGSSSRASYYGTTSVNPKVQVEGSDANTSSISVNRTNGDSYIFINNSSTVSENDELGSINFGGGDGSTLVNAARIEAEVDGTPGADDMPGRLIFSTTPDGSNSPVEAMRIDSSGDVTIAGNLSSDNFYVPTTNELALRPDGSTEAVRINPSVTTINTDLRIVEPTNARLDIRGDAGSNREIFIRSSNNARWMLRANTLAESGSDVGSNLELYGFTDAGIADEVFEVRRDNRRMVIRKELVLDNGVFFGGESSANLMDDYEEGAWTATYEPQTGSFATMVMESVMSYTKVGRLVTLHGYIRTDDVDITGGSGDIYITGIPFTISGRASARVEALSWSTAPMVVVADFPNNVLLLASRSSLSSNDSDVQVNALTTGTNANSNQIIFSITYATTA